MFGEPSAEPPFCPLSTGPCLHCVTVHCLARNRRLASEIPLSTLVAVDRLTSFGSVWRRCTKALRKQPMRGIESSGSKRTSLRKPWAAPPFRHLSTGPCLHCVTVHCLASSQRSVTSPQKGTASFPSTKNGACRPRLAPQCLHSLVVYLIVSVLVVISGWFFHLGFDIQGAVCGP